MNNRSFMDVWSGFEGPDFHVFGNHDMDLGVAVSDSPHGPFKRISPEPVLMISEDYSDFDSYRVDDASLLHFNGNESYLIHFKCEIKNQTSDQ